MSARAIRLGISPCPNDTFAFHALLSGAIDTHGLEFETVFLDIEELNARMLAGTLDVAKVSFHAALAMAGDVLVLPSGSALGFGVGPVVLARKDDALQKADPRVLAPGQWTTAHLLWRLFHPNSKDVRQAIFHEIMPALENGEADVGICIHEGRFTFGEHGLALVEDLGRRWEDETGEALPLGGIVGRRTLDRDTLRSFQALLWESIRWAGKHRAACLPTMRAHAQETDPAVLFQHVDLYVNEWTQDLGARGRSALDALAWRARAQGVLPPSSRPLEILE